MHIVVPHPANFAWSSDAVEPSIPLSTDAAGPHTWKLDIDVEDVLHPRKRADAGQ